MSEHPLTPQNLTIIVAGWNQNQIDDALKQYGTDTATVTVISVTDSLTALPDALALPVETPWCFLPFANWTAIRALTGRFGSSKPLAQCISMTPNDYAINPKAFT